MKKIFWITPASFWDVDLPIVKELQTYFYIEWHFFENFQSDNATHQLLIRESSVLPNLNLQIHPWNGRHSLKGHLLMFKTLLQTKRKNYDIFYTSSYSFPFGFLAYKTLLNQNKIVYACHNVVTPLGSSRYKRSKIETWLWLRTAKNIHVFSQSQLDVLNKRHPGKNTLLARLAMKDYGEPTIQIDKRDASLIRFLNFGIILPYKRLDLLISAADILYERGYKNFKVKIAGKCGAFASLYGRNIKHPEIFELDIRKIPNDEVADLFAQAHYFVMPYQDIAQSGAITVAFRYNVPVIASSIYQFDEFVHDNIDGYRFETENPIALADTMQKAIENHKSSYEKLLDKQLAFSKDVLSLESIVGKYKQFLESLC